MTPPDKICVSCGRAIEWRKRWEKQWDEVRYCSKRCRAHKPNKLDLKLEDAMLELLGRAPASKGIDPQEALSQLGLGKDMHQRARNAARRLVAKQKAVVVQKGRVVDPSTARGPITLKAR